MKAFEAELSDFGRIKKDERGAALFFEEDNFAPEGDNRDVLDLIGPHLVEGSVAVLQEVGYEGMRYFFGVSQAIVGGSLERFQVNIDDIFKQLEDKRLKKVSRVLY